MSQRDSGYERKERDLYETPEWVTELVIPHIPLRISKVWEPACGSGRMADVLFSGRFGGWHTDISTGSDFFKAVCPDGCEAIITNPPYETAPDFCDRSIRMMEPRSGIVAMLLRTDFDHAKTRASLFAGHRAFSKKVVLTKRIRWFEDSKGSPSFNHAWFIWDWQHKGAPTLAYAP